MSDDIIRNMVVPDYGSTGSLKKFRDTVEEYSQENMTVEYIKGAYYAYGSELACLRLFHRYNLSSHNPKVRAGFSVNLKTWYFALEISE